METQILLLLTLSGLSLAANCPKGWLPFKDYCYFFTEHYYTFSTAKDLCRSREGDIVSFNTLEERNFVHRYSVQVTNKQTWIGLERKGGEWVWSDGSTPGPEDEDIVKWGQGYPLEDENMNCGYIGADSFWKNAPCASRKQGVCKRRNDVYDLCDIEGGWHPYENECYKYFAEPRSWNGARQACQSVGGDLIRLEDPHKYHILSEVIDCTDYERGIWIGLSDTNTSDIYKWVDGSILEEANWDARQPPDPGTNPGDNCVDAAPLKSYFWRVDRCAEENNYVCQRPQASCAPEWLDYSSGACYQVFGQAVADRLTWIEANRYCSLIAPGGLLMKITDENQQNAAKEIIKLNKDSGLDLLMIGISDQRQDNVYEWSDGTYMGYQYWGNTDVEQIEERWDCGYVRTSGNEAKWRLGYCFAPQPFICQIPVHADPKPVVPPAPYACDEGWYVDQVNGDCYYKGADNEELNYDQMMAKCTELQAEPITINNGFQQAFIANLMIGITTIPLEYNPSCECYRWHDGSYLTFMNWDIGGKDHDAANPVVRMAISQASRGVWSSQYRSKERNYLCRKRAFDAASTPPTPPVVTPPISEECGPGWSYNPMGDQCYLLNQDRLNWEDARTACQNLGGDLVSIKDPQEQTYINALIMTLAGGSPVYWTGGNDIERDMGWQWTDGSPFPYFNWEDGEPNDDTGVEWCIELAAPKGGLWNDLDCMTPWASICKKPPIGSVTPPPTDPPPLPPPECPDPMDLVSGSHYVMDWAFYGTSAIEGSEAYRARLDSQTSGGGGGWRAQTSDGQPHISVTFMTPVHVTFAVTQGHQSRDEWVTKYQVSYRLVEEDNYLWVRDEQGNIMTFDGNSDRNTKVENALTSTGILATRVRIHPTQYKDAVSMRIGFKGCTYTGCSNEQALVSGNIIVPDERMTASSQWDENHGPERARIRSFKEGDLRGGWVAQEWNTNQWLQVEFDTYMTVRKIKTKGREDYPQWTKTYKVQLSFDGQNWHTYQDPYGTDKIFNGNSDQDTAVENVLPAAMRAKFVRINPQSWQNGISLRVEVRGCRHADCSDVKLISGDNHYLPDNKLTCTTNVNQHGPARSRLYTQIEGTKAGGWVPRIQDDKQWIQVDLGYDVMIQGIIIQGQHMYPNFVTEFYVSYSRDLDTWTTYKNPGDDQTTLLDGSFDNKTPRTRYFEEPFLARGVRLHPTQWNNSIAVRWEVLGCPGAQSSKDLGCFADRKNSRDLPNSFISDPPGGMTRDFCKRHCFNEAYKFAGVQYGTECWCGNTYGSFGPSHECNIQCSGDASQRCGGHWENDVMSTGISAFFEGCPDKWIGAGDSCYRVFWQKMSWNNADYACRQIGHNVYLASINSPQEQSFIETQMEIYKTDLWIGLHCQQLNNYFLWVNGEEVQFTYWAPREPNSYYAKEDCVHIHYTEPGSNTHFKWNDEPCGDRRERAYVCERPKEPMDTNPSPAPDEGCPDWTWVGYRWKCYSFITRKGTWQFARESCEGMGGTLARIEDGTEQAFIHFKFGERGDSGRFWTDLNNAEDEHTFKFTNGQSPQQTFWANNQPGSKEGPSYVVLNMDNDENGMWRNVAGDHINQFVCERLKDGVTKPPDISTPTASGDCPDGWRPYGTNDCVQINVKGSTAQLNWNQAQADCQAKGGSNLVSVHNQDLQDQLYGYIVSQESSFWIGLTNIDEDKGFMWADGSPVEYTYWDAPDEPSEDPSRNCVELKHTASGMWGTTYCSDTKNWICRIRKGTYNTPTPTESWPTPGPSGSCFPDTDTWLFYDEKCWFFSPLNPEAVRTVITWHEADSFCRTYNGYLASIHTPNQNLFARGQLIGVDQPDVWIGLNEVSGNGGWSWVDGSPSEYVNWGENQPDDTKGPAFCATMDLKHGSHGKWNNKNCNINYHFICSKIPGSTPSPTPAPTPMPGGCPSGYLTYLDKCFKFVEQKLSWSAARSKCLEDNTRPYSLASIHNHWETYFLTSQMKGKSSSYWIGLHQFNGGDGQYGWADNSKVTYTNWVSYAPGGRPEESCVAMLNGMDSAGQWNDVSCESERSFICMRYKDPNLEPNDVKALVDCGSDEYTYWEGTGNCYHVATNRRSWSDANAFCSELDNSRLASIHDVYEQAWIGQQFRRKLLNNQIDVWIGLSDNENEGRYTWADGSSVLYTHWASNQPSQTKRCACLSVNDYAMWAVRDCTTTMGIVCKVTLNGPTWTRPPAGSCPPSTTGIDWIEFGDSCYWFAINEQKTYTEAQVECFKQNSDLVSIHSDAETDFLVAHCQSQTPHWQWMGLMRAQEGGWRWTDGSSFGYSNWNPGEPSDPDGSDGENCGEFYTFGKWNDVTCDKRNGFICKVKRDTGSTPMTTTPPTVPSSLTSTPSSTTSATGSTTVPGPGPSSTTYKPPTQPPEESTDGGGLDSGAVAGIVFGVLFAVIILGFGGLLFYRKRYGAANPFMESFDNPAYSSSSDTVKMGRT